MAILELQSGDNNLNKITNFDEISKLLNPLNLELSRWPIEKTPRIGELLSKTSLNDTEKEELLAALDDRFYEQKATYGYQSRDLVVLHQDVPKLEEMLNAFDKVHTHDDDEVRYIIDGAGIFGVLLADGSQCRLTVESGEYIRVPKNTKHWFVLTEQKRIKAVRYFTNKNGWAAKYTGDKINVG